MCSIDLTYVLQWTKRDIFVHINSFPKTSRIVIPGPVSCHCPGSSLETSPRWHATIYTKTSHTVHCNVQSRTVCMCSTLYTAAMLGAFLDIATICENPVVYGLCSMGTASFIRLLVKMIAPSKNCTVGVIRI